jgi:electron transfer flavoprotein alpha subunit
VAGVPIADNAAYAHQLPENVTSLVASLVLRLYAIYNYLLAPATSDGKNILPRVAARFDVEEISEIISLENVDAFKH